MTQYLLLIHGNVTSESTPAEWEAFFRSARESGLFRGGSELGNRIILGATASAQPTHPIVAFMRFDADDQQPVLDLLQQHPVLVHGGSAELCELIES